MDMYDFDSSDEKEQIYDHESNHQSSGGCKTGTETVSTDHDRPEVKKSKTIKKSYQPIRDGNIYIRYEDDPVEYKRLRKKIQNRESAARVRGRKKGTMESLEVEVQQLKKVNSELMLRNATLETQNRSLKNQVEFLRGIIKPNNKTNQQNASSESIDKYLNLQPSKKQMKPEEQYESPFEEEDSALSWVRSSYSYGSRSNWSTIFILTIVVCVFVLPSSDSDTTVVAQQVGNTVLANQSSLFDGILSYGKVFVKYLVITGYLLFVGSFAYGKYCKSKLKKF